MPVIAVSSTIAADLRARAPELASTRIEIIPNAIDIRALVETVHDTTPPMAGPYVLYAGKLAPNKGVHKLIDALRIAPLPWPVVIVGDGPDRAALDQAARGLSTPVVFHGWLSRDDTLRWMRHAALLAFPSHGPESLSRVLIEASVLGLPIAAMDTGGTRDVVTHGITGLLSRTTDAFAADLVRLVADRALAAALGQGARDRAQHFDAARIVGRVEDLYRELIAARSVARA